MYTVVLVHRANQQKGEELTSQTRCSCCHQHGHLQVAASYVNLAGLLKSENRLAEALPYFNKALDIRERAYGPDHPDVSAAQISLAELLKDLGK